VDPADKDYYEGRIKRLLRRNPRVEFLGEVRDSEKNELLGNALAFLHPVDWPEPFGVAMIEAMACGTPVIARRCGSIPEVVDDGVTGFVFERDEDAVDLLKRRVPQLSRRKVREQFETRFSSARMAEEYAQEYKTVCVGAGCI
jgi:glycosyltransferase involved in cell wall biosynthesis